MKRKIEVPLWLLVLSTSLHLLWTVGLVVVLIVTATTPPPGVVTVVEIRVTATPAPVTATLAPVTATATSGGVVLDTSGIKRVEVIGKERKETVTDNDGRPYTSPTPEEEFLLVYLRLPDETTRAEIAPWFGNGDTLLPAVIDENDYQTDWKIILAGYTKDGRRLLTLIFLVKKAANDETLIFPDGARVDLSLVPDVVF